ncbi:tyrosine-protein phosphatase 10D-like [Ruditapes philippinarum]|uniref:tyrosine-protein phosphatase 10D-like n=1 Tax=Ruditapes philippinarum TaxID=129788 RepID=UPI00295BBA26|nr:tyrosine-protein phosphatase 10D-like [Ruditapes philippinarum]
MTEIAQSKEFNVIGYENRNYLVTGLEEFWNYTVTVTASTSIGSVTSDVSDNYRTLPAAPGKVSSFSVQDGPGQTLNISWKTPNILERNSKIMKYRFIHNATGDLQSQQILNQNADENYEYSISLDVVPETFYYFEVFAINEQNMNGEKLITVKQAHAKVPVNIEETLGVDVIPLRLLKDIERTQFTVTLLKEFFEESTNGEIKATGIIACVKDCNLEDIRKVTDFDTMKTWKQFTDQGPGFYRVTSPFWFDEIQTFCNTGRKKRSIKSFEYTLGSEYCTYLPADEYCNGPLQPGTSYKLVAVVCNIGGCLLSRQYGPFITAAAARVIEDSNCSTQSIVIGVVLGLIILVLLVYAGYTTITLRRIRSKDGQKTNSNDKSGNISQTYANEAFGSEVTRRDYGNPAGQYSESEYHTLDSNTREDRTTYDTLRNGP